MNKDLLNNPENPCESNTFGRRATLSSNRKGFTLAETMIVVVILGLIATLTVPNLINKQKETTQRTKVKKAMAAYEQAVNKMLLEHDRSFSNLNGAGCNKTANHFKYIKRDSNNGCIFQAPDKLWWDLTYIERPVISFNEITAQNRGTILENANNPSDMSAFVMVGRFDDQGILRVDDLAYETQHSLKDANNYESKAQLEKLYNYTNIIKSCDFICKVTTYKNTPCIGEKSEYKECVHKKNSASIGNYFDYYDNNGNLIGTTFNCDENGNNCTSSDISEYDSNNNEITYYYNCDGSWGNCTDMQKYEYDSNNNNTVTYYCDGDGNSCTSSKKEYNANNKKTTQYNGCDENVDNCKSCMAYNGGKCKEKGEDGKYHP